MPAVTFVKCVTVHTGCVHEGDPMRSELFLGIDQGSSATKGVVIDQSGLTIAKWTTAVPEKRRDGRCVEQDPAGLLPSVEELLAKGREVAYTEGHPLRAWGLGVQRSGVLAWHAQSGTVVNPIFTWADTRTQPIIDGLALGVEEMASVTGVSTLAYFAAPKIHLLQRQFLEPAVRVATLDTFVLERLSQGAVFATEDTMAARTMLYSLDERDAGARGTAMAARMSVYSQGGPDGIVSQGSSSMFTCPQPERRKRYLAWLRMEQDVLKRTLPAHAEIEE